MANPSSTPASITRAIRRNSTERMPMDAVELLATQPSMGRPGRVLSTRELVVPDTPFVIPYRVRDNRLELIAVFHGRNTTVPSAYRRPSASIGGENFSVGS